jgi:hypothetical protein
MNIFVKIIMYFLFLYSIGKNVMVFPRVCF